MTVEFNLQMTQVFFCVYAGFVWINLKAVLTVDSLIREVFKIHFYSLFPNGHLSSVPSDGGDGDGITQQAVRLSIPD